MQLLFLLLFVFYSTPHDIQVAHYTISQDDENIIVDFGFEASDLRAALMDKSLSQENIQEYVDGTFSLKLNGEKQILCYDPAELRRKHIYMQARSPKPKEGIASLEIVNTCLLMIEGHSNVIELRLDEEERDFLMNKNRTRIVVNY